MTPPRTPTPTPLTGMHLLNHGVQYHTPFPIIAQSIWDGHAILGTDGSVHGDVATYAWILSTTENNVEADVKGGSFLPPTAQYTDPYSKCPEAAALLARLTWITQLLQ
jgi:hypothetical protein